MELPINLRESLVTKTDEYLEALAGHPSSEAIAAYLVEQLEAWGEDEGHDELLDEIEHDAGLDGSLLDVLETTIESNEEFSWTGEEVIGILEDLCMLEWDEDDDDDFDDDDFDDDDDDDDDF